MIVAFEFRYRYANALPVRILNRIAQASPLKIFLSRDKANYCLEAQGNQSELETLADAIAEALPLSLFLDGHTLKPLKAFRACEESLKEDKGATDIPYCPACYTAIVDHGADPYASCPVCSPQTARREDEAIDIAEYAKRLAGLGRVSLPTRHGTRDYFLLSRAPREAFDILVCDPARTDEFFWVTPSQMEALATVEKPSLRLRPKLMFRTEQNLKAPFYACRFPDDKPTLALAQHLAKCGIGAIGFVASEPRLSCVAVPNRRLVVTPGRDLLPLRLDAALPQPTWCAEGSFSAFGDAAGITVTQRRDPPMPTVRFSRGETPGAIRFAPAHAAMRSVSFENGLGCEPLMGIHLSRDADAQLCGFTPRIGYLSLLRFPKPAFQPSSVLKLIAASDEQGQRLVDNYTAQFPRPAEIVRTTSMPVNASLLESIWGTAALILGIYAGNDMHEACLALEAKAAEFTGKSGPRIDYKIIHDRREYHLDPLPSLRAAMSFKLAGADDYQIGFGFIDSLADFLALQCERAKGDLGVKGVTLSGAFFENPQLLHSTLRTVEKNFSVYTNRLLPIDGANIVAGALMLGYETI